MVIATAAIEPTGGNLGSTPRSDAFAQASISGTVITVVAYDATDTNPYHIVVFKRY